MMVHFGSLKATARACEVPGSDICPTVCAVLTREAFDKLPADLAKLLHIYIARKRFMMTGKRKAGEALPKLLI